MDPVGYTLFTVLGLTIYIFASRLLWPWWSRTNRIVEQNGEIIDQNENILIELRVMNGEDREEVEAEYYDFEEEE